MNMNSATRHAAIVVMICIYVAGGVLGATQATQPAQPAPKQADTKRVIPVKNVVPAGAAEFKGAVIKLEVIESPRSAHQR